MSNLPPGRAILGSIKPAVRRHRGADGAEIIHDDVTPPLAWTMARACCRELPKQNSLRHAVVVHPANMAKPTQSLFPDDVRDVTVNAEGSGHGNRGDAVVPLVPPGYANDDANTLVMKGVERAQVRCLRRPRLCSVQEGRQHKGDVHAAPTAER